MKSKVYFIPVSQKDALPTVKAKLSQLLEASAILECVRRGAQAVIKLHFGEEGNTGFVRPEYLRVIYDEIVQKGAFACAADTNTLYRGGRMHSEQHRELAYAHGFTPEIAGAEVVIPDDRKKEQFARVGINQRFIKQAGIAKIFLDADVLVGVSHFKGHMMTGFGGTLKNLGMGCASREGKMAQHCDVAPLLRAYACVGCGACAEVCPVNALVIKNKKAALEQDKCIGCASCIAACQYHAIDVDWDSGGNIIQEKMIEYALAVLQEKRGRCAFLNFALKITKECDCLAKDDPRIVPDIGILASSDPLSIDKATLDLVKQAAGKDIFKKVHPQIDGNKQLEYAFRIGLGNLDYELVELKQ